MTESNKPPLTEEEFLAAAKSTLDERAASLDSETHKRLQHARRAAVEAARIPSRTQQRPKWLVPAGSFAALAIVAGVTVYTLQIPQDATPVAALEDMHILTGAEDLELYEELDFYQWLTDEQGDVG